MSIDFSIKPVDDKKSRRGRPRKNRSTPIRNASEQKNGNGLDTRVELGAETKCLMSPR